MSDLRKAALEADLPGRIVAVAEWGNRKYAVKGMSIAESNRYLKSIRSADGTVDEDRFHVQLLIHSVVDPENGEPVFDQADAQTLLDGPRPVELLRVALNLAGLGGESQFEETVDDLKETPDADKS
jgi:hypothetical protein